MFRYSLILIFLLCLLVNADLLRTDWQIEIKNTGTVRIIQAQNMSVPQTDEEFNKISFNIPWKINKNSIIAYDSTGRLKTEYVPLNHSATEIITYLKEHDEKPQYYVAAAVYTTDELTLKKGSLWTLECNLPIKDMSKIVVKLPENASLAQINANIDHIISLEENQMSLIWYPKNANSFSISISWSFSDLEIGLVQEKTLIDSNDFLEKKNQEKNEIISDKTSNTTDDTEKKIIKNNGLPKNTFSQKKKSFVLPPSFFMLAIAAVLFIFSLTTLYQRRNKTLDVVKTVLDIKERKIVEFLENQDGPVTQKQISDGTNISISTVSAVVTRLEKRNIISREKVGRMAKVTLVNESGL